MTDITADAHFRHIWAVYDAAVLGRGVLGERVRRLAAIGQCASLGEAEEAEAQIEGALSSGAAAALEVLEVLLQACVYVGRPRVKRSIDRFLAVCDRLAIPIEALVRESLSPGWDEARDRAAEEARWLVGRDAFPARDAMVERYGWKGMSTGLMTQPANFPNIMRRLDALDPSYAEVWIRLMHEGMYARPVLDTETRTLVMIADCIATREMTQATQHMTNAVRLGIAPERILEICIHSTLYAGMPTLNAAYVLLEILEKEELSLAPRDAARAAD